MTVISIFSHVIADEGRNRSSHNMLNARNDDEAIQAFLRRRSSPETLRSYSREINRLQQWAAFARRKVVSDLMPEDYDDYANFLRKPAEQWCGKLINGPLSESSLRHSMAVVSSLLNFWVKYGYLVQFPMFAALKRPSHEVIRERVRERQLDKEQLKAFIDYAYADTLDFDRSRMRFAASLMLLLGLRISEVADRKFSDFNKIGNQWILKVIGKGSKYEEMPVHQNLLHELELYKQSLTVNCIVPLSQMDSLLVDRSGKGIGARRIRMLIKDAIVEASKTLPGPSREAMAECSPHWFRHMFASQLKNCKISEEHVQRLCRHSKRETTHLYQDSLEQARFESMEKLTISSYLSVD